MVRFGGPAFTQGDRVKVLSGDFEGQYGTVMCEGHSRGVWSVRIDNVAMNPWNFLTHELTKLVDREKLGSLNVSKQNATPSRFRVPTVPPSVRPSGKKPKRETTDI